MRGVGQAITGEIAGPLGELAATLETGGVVRWLRPEFQVPRAAAAAPTADEIDELLDGLCALAQHRAVHFLWRPQLADPADEAVLELAVAAGGVPIVTWNVRHFRGAERLGVDVRTPGLLLHDIGALR